MGSLQAQEILRITTEKGEVIKRDVALKWHLRSNHYPPVHSSFIPIAKEAIEHANDEDWDHTIDMPNGLTRTVAQIIEGLHLQSFLEREEE